jgi:probable HAF family extracellular repeat protein
MRFSFRRALLCGAVALSGCGGAQHSAYTITDLGVPDNFGDYVQSIAINSSGKALVISSSGGNPEALLTNSMVWSNGSAINLPSLGGYFNAAAAMNDQGMVVGVADTADQSGGSIRPYLWQNGTITDLSTAAGTIYPAAVNNSGWIVGTTYPAWGHAALLRNGQVTDLSVTLGTSSSNAVGINDNGDIVGNTYTDSNLGPLPSAYLLKAGQVTRLVSLGGPNSSAAAINRNGQIVGSANKPDSDGNGGYLSHAVLWHNGTVTDLGTLGGASSHANGLNSLGHVVGESATSNGSSAFVYRDGKMLDLNTLIPSNSGWVIWSARGINDSGQIVGQGIFGGNIRAFLLSPH